MQKDQGIVQDDRRQDQPKDKKRSQQLSLKEQRESVEQQPQYEHGKTPEDKKKAPEGQDLRNEGRVEDGKAPKTTKPGSGH
jgi:hypothetical protein